MSKHLSIGFSSSILMHFTRPSYWIVAFGLTGSGNCFYAPPLKKGANCFATVSLSVCRSVWRSVDQVLSAPYLLSPSFDQYQTWCRGCPQIVDVQVTCSKVKVKSFFWAQCVVQLINNLIPCLLASDRFCF